MQKCPACCFEFGFGRPFSQAKKMKIAKEGA
jgi:hypothetical protein